MESVELEPRPLLREPPTYDTWKNHWPQYMSAYNLAFNTETYATQQPETDPSRNDNIISARVAGYFLIELFNRHTSLTTEPCDRLSIELQSEGREPGMSANDVVFRIGKLYRDYFMRLFRTRTTRYPTPSLHPSRPSFDTLEDMTMDCMMVDNTDYRTAKRQVCVPVHHAFLSHTRLGSFPGRPSVPTDRQLQQAIDEGH